LTVVADTNPWRRIAKILPLLSSDNQGEVASTAAAITRILKVEGKSWGDLASRIQIEDGPWEEKAKPNGEARERRREEPPQWAREPPKQQARPGFDERRRRPSPWLQDKEDVQKTYDETRRGSARLDDWSLEFLASVHDWVVDQGRALTDRQRTKLNEIMDKIGL
jgi:hypothetical protein